VRLVADDFGSKSVSGIARLPALHLQEAFVLCHVKQGQMRRCCAEAEADLLMSYIQGEGRSQGTLFPVVLDDFVPADHVCRVIDAFVEKLKMSDLGFERAKAADTGRPGYDPRDFLKLYLYGYLNQIRSSRRLEAECRRNVELM
jgi:hypothetical protein